MSLAEIYAEAKSWQTAIGSALGFVALLCGALFNFHLNRKRDAALRSEEAQSVAAALYGEISLLRKEVLKLGNHVAWKSMRNEDFDEQFVADYKLISPALFAAFAPKLSILPPKLVIALGQFYADYQATNNALELLAEGKRGYTFSPLIVLEPALQAIVAIQPALREIETFAGIQTTKHDLDIADIDSAIDMERLRFED